MPRKGSNKEESVAETDKIEETTEQVEETPVVQEKIVENPLDLSDQSPAELAELQVNIKKQELENHLKSEAQRINDLSCPKCGENLGLKAEDYMKRGNLPQSTECKRGERDISAYINYKGEPENS